MKKITLLALITIILNTSFALAEEIIRSYRLPLDNPRLSSVAQKFEIVKRIDNNSAYEVYVPIIFEKDFLQLAPEATLLTFDINKRLKLLKGQKSSELDAYHSFPEVAATLTGWVKSYPSIASLEVYGKTKRENNLYALKIASKTALSKNSPTLAISAATHGDELITVEVVLALVAELLAGYGVDGRLTQMIDSHIIYILPVTSPDSFIAQERYIDYKDPNRVFPWPGDAGNEPIDCVAAWIDFFNIHQIAGTLDFHAYGELVMYPWGHTRQAPAVEDDREFMGLVEKMSHENGYIAGQISTTIYIATGNSADYFYWRQKTRAIVVEIGMEKIPSPRKIPQIVEKSREMVWQFIE